MRPVSFLIAALAVTPFTSATGQQPLPVVPGDRVRLYASQTADGQWGKFEGRIVDWLPDSVRLRTDDGVNVVAPVASITRLEWSRGRKAFGAGRGAVAGAVIGIPLGVVIGLATYEECVVQEVNFIFTNCTFALSKDEAALGGAILGGVGGALLGAILGGTIKTERWEEVPLDRLRVGIAPQRDGGFALGLAVTF